MNHKKIQLFLTQNGPAIRHWMVIVVGTALLIFSMVSYAQQNRLSKQVKFLSEQNYNLSVKNNDLSNQIKIQGKQNQTIAKQNQDYVKCLFRTLAPLRPFNIKDLDTCDISVIPTSSGSTSVTAPTSSQKPSSSPSSNNPPPQNNSQPDSSQNTQGNNPKLLNCTIDLLGLHIGC